MVLAF